MRMMGICKTFSNLHRSVLKHEAILTYDRIHTICVGEISEHEIAFSRYPYFIYRIQALLLLHYSL